MNRQMWAKSRSFVGLIALLCCVLPLPFILPEFHLSITTFLLINLILVVSFRLIATMGLFNFAHISLMSIGAYTAGLLVIRLGWSFWLAFPVAVLVSALVSLLIGLPILRTKGFQFFIASFAAGEAIRWTWIIFRELFGGYAGIGLIPRPEPILGISFDSSTSYFYLVLGFTLFSLVTMYRLEMSRIGDTVKSINSSTDLCESAGINTYRYKTLVFVIASSFAGLAGVLFSFYTGTACPGDFTFVYSINILIFMIVGGIGSFAGPIIGAISLTVVGELLRDFLKYLPLIYGAIVIVVVLLLPGGLVSLPRRIQMMRKKVAR